MVRTAFFSDNKDEVANPDDMAMDTSDAASNYKLGLKHLNENEIEKAIDSFKKLEVSHPVHYYVGAGYAKLKLSDADGAIVDFKNALAADVSGSLRFKAMSGLCAAYTKVSRTSDAAKLSLIHI